MNPMEHIDNYMANSLSATDKKLFEDAMLHDPDLKRLVENYEMTKQISEQILEAELLQEVKAAAKPRMTHRTFSWPKALGIAASILLVAIAGKFLYDNTQIIPEPQRHALKTKYFVDHPADSDIDRGGKKPPPGSIEEAKDSYLRNYWKKSVKEFNLIIKNAPKSENLDTIRFWTGNAHFKLAEFRKALHQYDQTDYDRSVCHAQLCRVILLEIPESDIDPICHVEY